MDALGRRAPHLLCWPGPLKAGGLISKLSQTRASPPAFREKLSWCLFDFANSSFTTVVATVVFAVTFTDVVVGKGGWHGYQADSLWNLAGSLSALLVMVSAPVLGAMADRKAQKKRYLFRTYLVCVISTAFLTFMGPGLVVVSLLVFMAANVAFSLGENLIAGFLPELAAREEMGRLSGYGWAVGYLGGLLSLFLALPLVQGGHAELAPLSTALFFAVGGLPTFLYLRERARPRPDQAGGNLLKQAFGELGQTFRERRRFKDLFRFLTALILFQSGVVIIILNAAIYGKTAIHLTQEELVRLFILLQVSAAVGALVFGLLQDRIGSRPTLILTLLLWMLAVFLAWQARHPKAFTLAGLLAGAAMGSSQSASRALVGLLCPRGREAEWFGLWGLATKGAAVLGPACYALVRQFTRPRGAILSTLIFFCGGLLALLLVNVKRGRLAALDRL